MVAEHRAPEKSRSVNFQYCFIYRLFWVVRRCLVRKGVLTKEIRNKVNGKNSLLTATM